MDASQITKLLQKQNTRYINRCQTVDSSTLIWQNQIKASKYIKGVKTCDGQQNTNVPTNPACSEGNGICSFGGSGRTTSLQTGSPQKFLNVLSGASGSASQVYSSENITLQRAGKEYCGVAGTSPAPQNSYVVLPACYCVDTNGPTNSNSSELSNVTPLPINNQSNPYLPPFDTYYKFKNPSAQCQQPIQDQNQKHFVKECHSRFPNANNGVNAVFSPCDNVTELDPVTKQFHTTNSNPPTCEGCIIEPISGPCPNPIIDFYQIGSIFDTPPEFILGTEFEWIPINTGNILLIPIFNEYATDTSYQVNITSINTGIIYSNTLNYEASLTISQSNCPSQRSITTPFCFLEGSPVTLADGTEIPIENIKVGDKVRGAFGETNEILALYRAYLGNNTITEINNEHRTTSPHPHVGADKQFYAPNIDFVFKKAYGNYHPVINAEGKSVRRFLSGLSKKRLHHMNIGTVLQTISGPRTVETLCTYSMPEHTKIYNLVVSGSHTYFVNGYAVAGWSCETDFDYDTWTSK